MWFFRNTMPRAAHRCAEVLRIRTGVLHQRTSLLLYKTWRVISSKPKFNLGFLLTAGSASEHPPPTQLMGDRREQRTSAHCSHAVTSSVTRRIAFFQPPRPRQKQDKSCQFSLLVTFLLGF